MEFLKKYQSFFWGLLVGLIIIINIYPKSTPAPIPTPVDNSAIGKVGFVINTPLQPTQSYYFTIHMRYKVLAIHHVDMDVTVTAQDDASAQTQLSDIMTQFIAMGNGVDSYSVSSKKKIAINKYYYILHTLQTSMSVKSKDFHAMFQGTSVADAETKLDKVLGDISGNGMIDYDFTSFKMVP